MLRNVFYFSLICLFLGACKGEKEKNNIEILPVSTSVSTSGVLNLSEITSSVECIPLETNDSVLIGEIIRIVDVNEQCFYVADRYSIYKFNKEGSFCEKFSKQGEGADEYLHIADFQIGDDGSLWVLSRTGRSLYHYQWDGVLLKKIGLNCWASKLSLLSDAKMLLYVGNEKEEENGTQLKVLDLNTGLYSNSYLTIDDNKSNYLHVKSINNFSRKSSDEGYFYQSFCDTIYTISAQKIIPTFYLDIEGKNIPASFFETKYRDIMDFFQTLSKENYAYGTDLFLKSENQYVVAYYYSGKYHLSVISDSGECHTGIKLCDDVCLAGFPIELEELGKFVLSSDELVLTLLPSDVMDYARNSLDAQSIDSLMAKINYIGDDQNCILLKIKF